jgi:GNAT superfamily N-acetyltransferase
VELREHVSEDLFLEQVARQQIMGYALAYVEDEGLIRAVAGYRIGECLSWGRFFYVDDLCTARDSRSLGYGGALFDWLVDLARRERCDQFHLDSGVQRFGAHRFYLRKRMDITSHHFALKLKERD